MKENDFTSEAIAPEYFALGPLDGRYAKVAKELAPYFSEYALQRYRVKVEIEWLCALIGAFRKIDREDHKNSNDAIAAVGKHCVDISSIRSIYEKFSDASFTRIKEIEAVTNHDVKSVELFVAEQLRELGLSDLVSYVHIGCTSEDITNCAYALMINAAIDEVWLPAATELVDSIVKIGRAHINTAMLAHAHGQPATPTTVGKEMAVYVHRLFNALYRINDTPIYAKFNGASGNYSAISTVFPEIANHVQPGSLRWSWNVIANMFIVKLGQHDLSFNPVTTQIESHDGLCQLMDGIRHFNNILRDFDQDMWLYISMDYFKQIPVESEVGSSTMPHKVNPIKFENSEANVKMSNAICVVLSEELPRSRMQRDLTDSSLQRNIGLAFGYSLQAIEQTIRGLSGAAVNTDKLSADLNNNWEVLAEPIQTMLRKYGIPDAYDQLKKLTRGKRITKKTLRKFIESLDIPAADKAILLKLTPATYIGLAPKIAQAEFNEWSRSPYSD